MHSRRFDAVLKTVKSRLDKNQDLKQLMFKQLRIGLVMHSKNFDVRLISDSHIVKTNLMNRAQRVDVFYECLKGSLND